MSDVKQPRPKELLPIKVILPRQGTERRVDGGGTPPKPFRTVDEQYRQGLSKQVQVLSEAMKAPIKEIGAVPVRVKLISKATAKSHRPEKIFSNDTCPIVGAGKQGEIFIKATVEGLNKINHLIQHNHSDKVVKELSCIDSIEPITPSFRRGGIEANDILKKSPRRGQGFSTRVRLFNFGGAPEQEKLISNFTKICKEHGIEIQMGGYDPQSYIFEVECKAIQDVNTLSSIVGVRSVSYMPLIRTVRQNAMNMQAIPNLPHRKEENDDFPVVVVVDSGVTNKIPALESWVVGRSSDVAPQYQNNDHGTFVAGLICFGENLNPTFPGIDPGPCGIYDLQLIPNDNPEKGDTEDLSESEFLVSLENALQQHANKYNVWNLSLGTEVVCSLDEFSALAEQLDNLQEKYRVSFVISAGNYQALPLLNFPREGGQITDGRITSPADSVLGITVGSISHVDYKNKGPKEHHLSAFSRHGSGPNHIIKPDLVHYGGAISLDGTHASGIRSLTEQGMVEDIGTSFSTPLVSRTLAQIYHNITPTPSPVLARAVLTHHATDPRSQGRVPDGDENFFGFGLPSVAPNCLECTPFTSTLIFEDVLRPGFYQEWDDFPYPPSLYREGKFFGEIWMTIAFAPSRGARWGTEYCETHIEANFGVYRSVTSRKTGEISEKFVGLVPPEHKNPGLLYESFQVETLRKWAPVRTYHRDLGEKGERGDRWRLKLRLLTRHGIDLTNLNPQPFSMIVTISDPTKKVGVYDEMAQIIRHRFRSQNLTVRTPVRLQV